MEQVTLGCACPGRLGGDPISCVSLPHPFCSPGGNGFHHLGLPPRLTAGDHAGGDEDFRFSQSDRGSGPMGCLRATAILDFDC